MAFLQSVMFARDYESMLQRLAWLIGIETFVGTWILRQVPKIDQMFQKWESVLPVETWPKISQFIGSINPSGFLIAIVVAALSMAVHFHDKLSDLFRIRERFDIGSIMVPLAALTGAHLTLRALNELKLQRHTIMRQVFYPYASSKASNPIVDKHDIEHAMNNWSLFWITIEGMALWLTMMIAAASFQGFRNAFVFSCLFVGYLVASIFFYQRATVRIKPQLQAIVNDPPSATAVRAVFNAI